MPPVDDEAEVTPLLEDEELVEVLVVVPPPEAPVPLVVVLLLLLPPHALPATAAAVRQVIERKIQETLFIDPACCFTRQRRDVEFLRRARVRRRPPRNSGKKPEVASHRGNHRR